MKNTLHKILCGIMFTLSFQAGAQDIHLSKFFESPLLRISALAGIFSGDLSLQSVHRTQWQSVTVPYQSTSHNGEVKPGAGNSGEFLTPGAPVLLDKTGSIDMKVTHIKPELNFHKSLSGERNMYLFVGFMGGMVQRKFDTGKVTTSLFDGMAYNDILPDGETFPSTTWNCLTKIFEPGYYQQGCCTLAQVLKIVRSYAKVVC